MKLNEVAIKLTPRHNQNTRPFIEELWDKTKPSALGQGRLYGDVQITAEPFGGKIHLGDIVALGEKGQGEGTKALKFLTQLADRHNVVLQGTAKAYSQDPDHIQDSEQHLAWYKKHGFKHIGANEIVYRPKRSHLIPL